MKNAKFRSSSPENAKSEKTFVDDVCLESESNASTGIRIVDVVTGIAKQNSIEEPLLNCVKGVYSFYKTFQLNPPKLNARTKDGKVRNTSLQSKSGAGASHGIQEEGISGLCVKRSLPC